jgi:hypothetical protein
MMLLTTERMVPVTAMDDWRLSRGDSVKTLSSWINSTASCKVAVRYPLGPLADTTRPFTLNSTPLGNSIGFFAILDMSLT